MENVKDVLSKLQFGEENGMKNLGNKDKIIKAFDEADSKLFDLHDLMREEDLTGDLWREVYKMRVHLNQMIKVMYCNHFKGA